MGKGWKDREYKRLLTVLSTAACLTVSGSFAPSPVQNANASAVFNLAARWQAADPLVQAVQAGEIEGRAFRDPAAMLEFYKNRDNKPYWLKGAAAGGKAGQLLERLEQSWTHGLNPETYHLSRLRELLPSAKPEESASLELLLTDAFMRYAADLSGMRVSGESLRVDKADWKQPLQGPDLAALLADEKREFPQILDGLEPVGGIYAALRKELIRLAGKLKAGGPESGESVELGGPLKPGGSHPAVARFRERFGLDQPARNPNYYDDALAAAIMALQREHGIDADGIIGPETLRLLNRTDRDKYLQILANLERLRWVDPNLGARYAVVNIPSSRLWAIEDGQVALEMPLIVGSPARRTQTFKTAITGVRLNPTWTIPPTIKKQDILPAIQEDLNFLYDRQIELYKTVDGKSVSIDPMTVDWDSITPKELHAMRMVQMPGERNPLGRIRLLMPNPYDIYLHDTNRPDMFNGEDLALSSGCMRMKEPEKMVSFLMKGSKGWSEEKMQETLASGRKTDFSLAESVPVYVFYYTLWLDRSGGIVYGNDIYNYDTALIEELTGINGIILPKKIQEITEVSSEIAKATE